MISLYIIVVKLIPREYNLSTRFFPGASYTNHKTLLIDQEKRTYYLILIFRLYTGVTNTGSNVHVKNI